MLSLWWGITEQTYLYYWHHDPWRVLAGWGIVVLILFSIPVIGEELWRAGNRAALRSTAEVEDAPGPAPAPVALKGDDQ